MTIRIRKNTFAINLFLDPCSSAGSRARERRLLRAVDPSLPVWPRRDDSYHGSHFCQIHFLLPESTRSASAAVSFAVRYMRLNLLYDNISIVPQVIRYRFFNLVSLSQVFSERCGSPAASVRAVWNYRFAIYPVFQ